MNFCLGPRPVTLSFSGEVPQNKCWGSNHRSDRSAVGFESIPSRTVCTFALLDWLQRMCRRPCRRGYFCGGYRTEGFPLRPPQIGAIVAGYGSRTESRVLWAVDGRGPQQYHQNPDRLTCQPCAVRSHLPDGVPAHCLPRRSLLTTWIRCGDVSWVYLAFFPTPGPIPQ